VVRVKIETPHPYEHHVIGAVHEIVPSDSGRSALEAAMRHEIDECGAPRIVVDLADQPSITDDQVDVIIDVADPSSKHWVIRLPADVDPSQVDRLCDAGFGGDLVDDNAGHQPHHFHHR
jgi:hypothetical protein